MAGAPPSASVVATVPAVPRKRRRCGDCACVPGCFVRSVVAAFFMLAPWVSVVAKMRSDFCSEVGGPAAVTGDVAGIVQRCRFADETFDAAAVGQLHGADAERRRDRGDEAAEIAQRHFPDFGKDGGTIVVIAATA